MHPILASRRRLLAYLLAWIPILALLIYVAWASGGVTWRDAAAVLAPACLVYAFACLSPWYICQTRPLRLSGLSYLAADLGRRRRGGRFVAGGERTAGRVPARAARAATGPALRHGRAALPALGRAALRRTGGGGVPRRGAPRRRSPHAGPRSRTAGPASSDQPAFPVQQSSLHRRPHHLGWRARPRNVRAPGRISAQQPRIGRPREHPLARGTGPGPSLPGGGAGSLRRPPQGGTARGTGMRGVHGARTPAPAAGGERRQARDRRPGGRRIDTPGGAPRRRLDRHRHRKRFRPRRARPAQKRLGPQPRPPAPRGAVRRRGGLPGRPVRPGLPRIAAFSRRIARGPSPMASSSRA